MAISVTQSVISNNVVCKIKMRKVKELINLFSMTTDPQTEETLSY